jgi:hypothetical protein
MSSLEERLYAVIDQHFALAELRELCGDAKINFDNLFGDGTRRSKISSIVQDAKRHDKLGDLARSIHRLRPKLPDLLVIEVEHYFQNPTMNTTDVMKPPPSNNGVFISGDACVNIGFALEKLGIGSHNGDKYDQLLSDLVFEFQEKYGHNQPDGFFGPGTRSLLVKAFVERFGTRYIKDFKIPAYPREYPKILPTILQNGFDLGELKSLCFDLDIEYDSLPGDGKAAKSRELVAYFIRRGRQRDLIDKVKELRPRADWPNDT